MDGSSAAASRLGNLMGGIPGGGVGVFASLVAPLLPRPAQRRALLVALALIGVMLLAGQPLSAQEQASPSFADDASIDNQSYTTGTAIDNLTLPQATGGDGTLSYSITPALPAGLEFNATTRVLSGTPTGVKRTTTYTYKVDDSDDDTSDADADSLTFTIIVQQSGTIKLILSSTALTVAEAGGTATYTFHVSKDPADAVRDPRGLLVRIESVKLVGADDPTDTSSGRASLGVSSTGARFTSDNWDDPVTVTVTGKSDDVVGDRTVEVYHRGQRTPSVNGTVTVTITDDVDPTFGESTIDDQSFTQNTQISAVTLPQATSGNAPLTYSITPDLPDGLTFNAATRVLSGRPTAAKAETTYTYKVTDGDGDTATLTFDITVAAAETTDGVKPTWKAGQSFEYVYEARVGVAFSLTLLEAEGGTGTLTYSLTPETGGALPPGMTFNASTRTLSGTPTAGMALTGYRYTATDTDGDTVSADVAVAVALAQLQGLTVKSVFGDANKLAVSWTAYTGAEQYLVQWKRERTGKADFPMFNSGTTVTTGRTHTITGLTADTTYTVRVTAVDTDADPDANLARAEADATTDAGVSLDQHHLIDDILIVTCTPSTDTGVTGYLVQWKTGNQSYSTTERSHTTGPDCSLPEVSGLALGNYTVKVTQQGGTGDGTSVEHTVTLHGWPGVVYVDPAAGDARAIDVEWETVSTAAGYVIQWRPDTRSSYPAENRATVTAANVSYRTGTTYPVYRVTGLEPNTVYYAKVTVYTADGSAAAPDGLSHEDYGTTHGELTGLAVWAVGGESDKLEVRWNVPVTSKAQFKVRGYRVQWKTSGAGSYPSANQATAASDATFHQITGLTGGTTYTVRVTVLGNWYGVHEDGDADEFSRRTFGIAGGESGGQEPTDGQGAAALTGLTVDSVTGEPARLAVSWNALDGAAKYSVRWKTGDGGYGSPVETTANSYTVTGLSPGTTYTVNVAALDAGNTLLAESVGSGATAPQTGGASGDSGDDPQDQPDSTPAVVFVIYYDPSAGDVAADRYNQAVKLLNDAGIAYTEVVGDIRADVDRLAGVTDSVLPRFFLGDPTEEGWTSQIKVNNGGLRWLKAKAAELSGD